MIRVKRANSSCRVLGSSRRQFGMLRFSVVVAGTTKRGALRFEPCVDALVAILREGQALLAPLGQFQ
jgi:hypothetical protein